MSTIKQCAKCRKYSRKKSAFFNIPTFDRMTRDHIYEKCDRLTKVKDTILGRQNLCRGCHNIKCKIFALKRNELNRKLTIDESRELNEAFLQGRYLFVRIEGKKRVIIQSGMVQPGQAYRPHKPEISIQIRIPLSTQVKDKLETPI